VARAYDAIKALFIAGGLKDEFKEDSKHGAGEIYSPHSMRKFAENYMIRCGLAEKHVYAITGHVTKMGATSSYLDWDDIGKAWNETCSDKMTWTQEIVRISEPNPQQEMRIKDLERKLTATLTVLASLGKDKASREFIEAQIGKNFASAVEAEEKKQILREMQGRPSKELPETVGA
jgi:hypothetical protein